MKTVRSRIADRQQQIKLHPFFRRLERNEPLTHVLPFVSHLSFWVMAFQDVLRLIEDRLQDARFKQIARHHRAEDAGHDKWFLTDLLKLQGLNPDLRTVFSPGHALTRANTYALMSEVFRARYDCEQVVLLLSLESTGHVFFERMATYLDRMGVQSLQYFSRSHLYVEREHRVFDAEMDTFLGSLELTAAERESACALVDRVYEAFSSMFDGFEAILRSVDATGARADADQPPATREPWPVEPPSEPR